MGEKESSATIRQGEGAYRVEQDIGGMSMCFQAPTMEEALAMAGMALEPAVFIWDCKCVPESEKDEALFDGWEPIGSRQGIRKVGHGTCDWWVMRKKIHRPPAGSIGIIGDESLSDGGEE